MSEQKQMSSFIRETKTREGKSYSPKRWQLVVKVAEKNPAYVPDTRDEDSRHEYIGRGKNRHLNPAYVPDGRAAGEKRETVWVQKTKAFTGTKSKATVALSEFVDEVKAKAGASDTAKQSVIDYTTAYIDLRERVQLDGMKKLEASTATDYRKSCARLEGSFSEVSMGEVTTKFVRNWERKALEDGMSVYQVRKCHRLLHLVFEHAYREEELSSNPVSLVTPPSAPKKEPNSLTQEGMRFVTAQLEAMQPTPVVTAAYIALHAGLRCAECCALTWGDIDFEAQTITVRGSIGVAKGGSYKKGTKTGKVRVVDFDSEHMANLLKARRSAMLADRDSVATDFDKLYVCGSVDGAYANPTNISREWSALSKGWGLVGTTGEDIHFHSLRHSFVTAQLSSGSSVRDVADNAGHSSTQMTVDTYASALRKGKKDAAAKSGAYMRPTDAEVLTFRKTGTEN